MVYHRTNIYLAAGRIYELQGNIQAALDIYNRANIEIPDGQFQLHINRLHI